jgi:DNA repair exonuclease SbcCD ATPase subunit
MGYALVNVNVILETESCGVCGTHFAIPDTLMRAAKNNPNYTFYCPMGHNIGYSTSEADRLRKKLDEQTKEATRQAQRALEAGVARDAEAKLRQKAERKLKRVSRGVCPSCNRTFDNLARHMACKHADEK